MGSALSIKVPMPFGAKIKESISSAKKVNGGRRILLDLKFFGVKKPLK